MTEQAIIALPDTGETFSAFGATLVFKVTTDKTADRIGIYAIEMEPFANGPKLHFHREMDETFIINEGKLTVLTADGETEARAGTIVYIPRGTVHGYKNNAPDKLKMTMIFNRDITVKTFSKSYIRAWKNNLRIYRSSSGYMRSTIVFRLTRMT